MASPEQVRAVGRFVRAALVRKPQIRYLCDPVIGDANGLYVPQSAAAEIRDELIPLAAIATPNLHELAWLTGRDDIVDIGQAEAAARELGPEIVVVTSAPANIDGNTGNLLVDRDIPIMAEHPLISGPRNGAGDMFSGLFLACLLDGLQPSEALEKATALVYGAIAAASAKGSDELMPHAVSGRPADPTAPLSMRKLQRSHRRQ
jgi:pyridoxine kinase